MFEDPLNGERGPWGRLEWSLPDGRRGTYQITPEDVLWGLRMIVGEGADDALEVLQTMAQRWVHVDQWATLEELFKAYSQPINPRWRRDGDKCRGRIGGVGCEENRLDRRDRLAKATLEELRNEAPRSMNQRGLDAALRWFRGLETTDRVPGAVHFAVQSLVVAHHGEENVVLRARNWFAVVGKTRNWPVDAVRVVPPSGMAGVARAPRLPSLPPGAEKATRRAFQAGAGAGVVWAGYKLLQALGWL